MSVYDLECYMNDLRIPHEVRLDVYSKIDSGSVAQARVWLDGFIHDCRSDV